MAKRSSSRVRLVDIAKRVGVSTMAVAHVLNGSGGKQIRVSEDTRARIEKAAIEANYRPNQAAQQLRGARSRLIGLILDSDWRSNLLSALEREGIRCGYRFLVGQIHGVPGLAQQYLDDFDSRAVEAVVCIIEANEETNDELQNLFQGRSNVIFHGRQLTDDGCCVRVDTADGIRQSVDYLVERGRNRIGLMLSNLTDRFNQARRTGYLDSLKKNGIDLDESLICVVDSKSQIPTIEHIKQAIHVLTEENKVDAVIAEDDLWALCFMQHLQRRGYKVPNDIAIVGYDNLDIATAFEPAMTTVDQQPDEYARQTLKLILELVEQGEVAEGQRVRTITPKLIVREST